MDVKQLNGLTLAYLGDAVYELYIRKHIVSKGYTKVNALHKKVIEYTSGNAQSLMIHYLLKENVLSDDEIAIFKRGRNSHVNSSRKNISLGDYLDATGFEALIGYLYISDNIFRLEEIIALLINYKEGGQEND